MRYLIIILIVWLLDCNLSAHDRHSHEAFNGLVVDMNDKPVKKARIYVRNPRNYTMSDKKGRFGLTDVMSTDTITVIVKKKVYNIPVDGRRSAVIRVTPDSIQSVEEDEQLVEWGFGYVSRREYTGVSNYISGEDLRRSGFHTVLEALQGRVPGLNINSTGADGGRIEANIRGTRSITDSGLPIFVLNDMVVPNFDGVHLNDVDYVEILKEAGVYGGGGSNGAIIVRTK